MEMGNGVLIGGGMVDNWYVWNLSALVRIETCGAKFA